MLFILETSSLKDPRFGYLDAGISGDVGHYSLLLLVVEVLWRIIRGLSRTISENQHILTPVDHIANWGDQLWCSANFPNIRNLIVHRTEGKLSIDDERFRIDEHVPVETEKDEYGARSANEWLRLTHVMVEEEPLDPMAVGVLGRPL